MVSVWYSMGGGSMSLGCWAAALAVPVAGAVAGELGVLTGDEANAAMVDVGVCTPTGPVVDGAGVVAGVEIPPNENPDLAAGVLAAADDSEVEDLEASFVEAPKTNPPVAGTGVDAFGASLDVEVPKLNPTEGAGASEESLDDSAWAEVEGAMKLKPPALDSAGLAAGAAAFAPKLNPPAAHG